MFDVILVTHKTMMTISGTLIQGLHSTQVRHHTQIDLLTCRVYFVRHMMINTQVRYHTHLDLTTCRVCHESIKHIMIMRHYFPRLWYDPHLLHARGLGLCLFFAMRWSVICCQDCCLMAFAQGALPEEYLSHNFDEQCLGGH